MCRCEDRKMHITYTFDSSHALPFHFLLNSLVNAEVCFVKAFKSPNSTIWIQRSPLEAIYYGWPLQSWDLCFAIARVLLASGQQHHHDQRRAFPCPGRGVHYSQAHSLMATAWWLLIDFILPQTFKRRNSPWFAVCNHLHQSSKWGELARSHREETWAAKAKYKFQKRLLSNYWKTQ